MKKMRIMILGVVIASAICCYVTVTNTVAQDANPQLLPIALQGCREAVSAISSGKGKVVVLESVRKREGGVLETETTYQLAFRGDKFRLHRVTAYLKNEPGEALEPNQTLVAVGESKTEDIAFDGTTVRYLDVDTNRARIGNTQTPIGGVEAMRHKLLTAVGSGETLGNGVCDLLAYHNSLLFGGTTCDGPSVVGRETIDGDSCIVVETVYNFDRGNGDTCRGIKRFWINPEKGYTVSRFRAWMEGGPYPARTLVGKIDMKPREYAGGVWGPDEVTDVRYEIDSTTGQAVVSSSKTIKFDAGFVLNADVTDQNLALVFPSATQVHDEVLDASYTMP